MPLSSRYDSGSLKLASHLLQSLDEPHFDDPAVQNMDMHQRSELWSQVRYKKIESIKNNSLIARRIVASDNIVQKFLIIQKLIGTCLTMDRGSFKKMLGATVAQRVRDDGR